MKVHDQLAIAIRFGWTPKQVDELEPEFVAEVLRYIRREERLKQKAIPGEVKHAIP